MVNNKVTMGPGKPPAGPTKSKKPGRFAPSRQNHEPMPKLAEPSTFMDVALKRFRQQNDAQTTASQVPTPGTVPAQPSKAPVHDFTPQSPKQAFKEIQTISRSELVPKSRRQSGFTDGNITNTSLSGFSPSINGDGFTTNAGSEPIKGLGISGIALPRASTASAETLMDVDIPAANNAVLTPSLQASPEETTISIPKSDFEQYQAFKAIMSGSRSTQDLLEWLDGQKKKSLPAKKETDVPSNKNLDKGPSVENETVVKIAAGYTIGSSQLERIIGDRNALLPSVKATQTTPSLSQSKWATEPVKQQGTRANVAVPEAEGFAISHPPVAKVERERRDVNPGGLPKQATQVVSSAPVRAGPSDRTGTARKQGASTAISISSDDTDPNPQTEAASSSRDVRDSKADDRTRLQAQMQAMTKSMARTKITTNGVSSAVTKTGAIGKSKAPNGRNALPLTNENGASRDFEESLSSIQGNSVGVSTSQVGKIRDKRLNPFAPREAGKAKNVNLKSTHEPVKFDLKGQAAKVERPNVLDENNTRLPVPQPIEDISRAPISQVDKVARSTVPPRAKESSPVFGKKGVTDSKWASSSSDAGMGPSNQAAISRNLDAEAEAVLPLRARAGNQVTGSATNARRAETDEPGRRVPQKPVKSTKPSLQTSAAPIFGDSRNLKHNSSTPKKSAAPAPKKLVPPGLQWIQKEQEEQRELAPDEIQQVSNGTHLSRESREALGLASDILRKYRDLD
jgi:hypothetical protein